MPGAESDDLRIVDNKETNDLDEIYLHFVIPLF